VPTTIALISDIHGNTPALQAVLEDIQHEACTEVLMLGDIINGIDPHGCIQLLREWCASEGVNLSCIRGNAETYLFIPDREKLPGLNDLESSDLVRQLNWWEAHLSEADLAWIRSFPESLQHDGVYLVHDSPMDRSAVSTPDGSGIDPRYREWFFHGRGITPAMDEQEWQKLLDFMSKEEIKRIYCGHTHVPFLRQTKNGLVCNAGSVGMPLDGNPQASWVRAVDDLSKEPVVSIRRVEYDIPLFHRLIDQTADYTSFERPGFREAYKKMFSTGIHWRAHINTM
jgi:predicted phosphodiesterase